MYTAIQAFQKIIFPENYSYSCICEIFHYKSISVERVIGNRFRSTGHIDRKSLPQTPAILRKEARTIIIIIKKLII